MPLPLLPKSALRAARVRALQAGGRLPPTPAAGPGSLADVARTMSATAETQAMRQSGKLQAAFRASNGEVFPSGSIHDLNAVPEHLHDDPGLATGFVDEQGRFMTRREAEARPPEETRGLLPAPNPVLGGEHSNLWLKARAEALRRHARDAPRAYVTLAREAEEGGGFTYGVRTGAKPRRGFAFSTSPENEAVLESLTPEAIAEYVRAHEAPLGGEGAFLGGWRSPEGKWYLDVSRILPDREAALREARAAGQRAVYDLASGETLEVPP